MTSMIEIVHYHNEKTELNVLSVLIGLAIRNSDN